MSPQNTRILKEVRLLFWPWLVITVIGLIAAPCEFNSSAAVSLACRVEFAVTIRLFKQFSLLVLLLGLPLLTTMSFGTELQDGTLSLLLSQPLERRKIWFEKLSVTAVAVSSAAFAYYYGWRQMFVWADMPATLAIRTSVLIIGMIASAPLFTLALRSALTGFLANLSFQFVLFLMEEPLVQSAVNSNSDVVPLVVVLGYSAIMLTLGYRQLLRFQPVSRVVSGDLQLFGSRRRESPSTPRYDSTRTFLNALRKELRLLKPLWLFTAVMVPVSTVSMLGVPLLLGTKAKTSAFLISILMTGVYAVVGPILAGSLPITAEKELATQAASLTLPISIREQWLLKLAVAGAAGFISAVLLPSLVLSLGLIVLGPVPNITAGHVLFYLLVAWGLTFASFWCASVTDSTMKAILWVLPGSLVLAAVYGAALAFDQILSSNSFLSAAISRLHPYPFADAVLSVAKTAAWLGLFVPLIIAGLTQSYRVFRTQHDSGGIIARRLPILAVVAITCALSVGILAAIADQPYVQALAVTREVHRELDRLSITTAGKTGRQMMQTSRLSPVAQAWLKESRIWSWTEYPRIERVTMVAFPEGLFCQVRRIRAVDTWFCSRPTFSSGFAQGSGEAEHPWQLLELP